jgi:hypothetical protein
MQRPWLRADVLASAPLHWSCLALKLLTPIELANECGKRTGMLQGQATAWATQNAEASCKS